LPLAPRNFRCRIGQVPAVGEDLEGEVPGPQPVLPGEGLKSRSDEMR